MGLAIQSTFGHYKVCSTQLSTSGTLHLVDDKGFVDSIEYQRIIRVLRYVSPACPDICLTVNKSS